MAQRDCLNEVLRFVRRGDTLLACKPDRLARSTADLLRIVDSFDRRGVGLIMLSMGGQRIDTPSPTGKLMITMLGAIAEFERGLLLERQREGVAKAKQEGKYKGRKATARAKAADVIRLDSDGLQRTEIAERLGIGTASVYRVSRRRKIVSRQSAGDGATITGDQEKARSEMGAPLGKREETRVACAYFCRFANHFRCQ